MCNDVLVLQRRKERLVGKIDMLQDILRISTKMIAFNETSAALQVDRKILLNFPSRYNLDAFLI